MAHRANSLISAKNRSLARGAKLTERIAKVHPCMNDHP